MKKTEETTVFASEIFSSAQGEGVLIGRRQLFVRFCECHRNCLYCDTQVKRTKTVSVENEPGSGIFQQAPNPLSPTDLLDLLNQLNKPEYGHDDLFLTGGEPLLQTTFLKTFLPLAHKKLKLPIHLETSGDLPEEFAIISPHIDHVLMDIKLPSVTGEPETWELHQEFIRTVMTTNIMATIKLVISADTSSADLTESAELISATETDAAVVLQPMTAASKTDRIPSAKQVLKWQAQMAKAIGRTVYVIPQSHKLMGLL
jgi:organic radical activating enzyme